MRAAAQLARDSLSQPAELDSVNWDELSELIERQSIVLLDVRPADEFAEDHLPGAINIPLTELGSRTSELRCDIEIVAYCRGPFCVLSEQAGVLLQREGFKVRTFAAGITASKA
jgi:rhodanese-related sulfurtransferase